jgi:predicted Rossmann fold flavoprotein
VPLRAGLVPLVAKESFVKKLEGLSLRNIRVKFTDGKREIISEIGELIFTASGISGPLVITLSGRVIDWLALGKPVLAQIDLKPALTIQQLDGRLLREFKVNSKKSIKNALKELLPLRLIKVFCDLCGIDLLKKCSQITQKEREIMITWLKGLRLEIMGSCPLDEGMVTRGGVSLKQIDPRTMQSRLIKGLYFCGEMIDVDADTGGFNLQAAFSTGYLAGESAAIN